jgi:hypothetical protein
MAQRDDRDEAIRNVLDADTELEPGLPIADDAEDDDLAPDLQEAIADTQTLAAELRDGRVRGEDPIERARNAVLAGGDVDAGRDQVDSGEEAVGGSTPTPDQDVVDDLGRAAGVTYSDTEPLRPE